MYCYGIILRGKVMECMYDRMMVMAVRIAATKAQQQALNARAGRAP